MHTMCMFALLTQIVVITQLEISITTPRQAGRTKYMNIGVCHWLTMATGNNLILCFWPHALNNVLIVYRKLSMLHMPTSGSKLT